MDTNALIRQLLSQLLAAEAAESWRSETGFPKIKRFWGVNFLILEPLNPDWQPTMEEIRLGPAGYQLVEPSNGDGSAKFPRRSPAGYPVAYGLEPDPTDPDGRRSVPSSRFPGRVMFANSTHDNDAAVQKYREDSAKQPTTYTVPDWTGPIPATSLDDDDWCWTLVRHIAWRNHIGGTWDQIRRLQMDARFRRMPTFDPQVYTGQLRDLT